MAIRQLPRDPEAACEALAKIHPSYGSVWRSRDDRGEPRAWYASMTERVETLAPTLAADTAVGLLRQLQSPPARICRIPYVDYDC